MLYRSGNGGSDRRLRLETPAIAVAPLGIAIGLVIVWITSESNRVDITLALAVTFAALLPTIVRILQGRFDLLEPSFVSGLVLAALFGIRPLYMLGDERTAYWGYGIEAGFTTAITLGFVGTVSFFLAYAFVGGSHAAETSERQSDAWPDHEVARRIASQLGLLVAGLGLTLFTIHLLRIGPPSYAIPLWLSGRSAELSEALTGASQYLSVSPILLACAATVIGVAGAWRLTRSQSIWIGVMATMPAAIFFVTGGRRFMVPCLLIPLAAYYLRTRRRPRPLLLLSLVPLLFVLLATIPYGRTAGAREQAGGVIPILTESVAAPFAAWDRFITHHDTAMVAALALQVQIQRQPNDFYYGGATFGDLILAPIPSALVPDKPISARDDMLIRLFGGPCQPTLGLCPDFSVIGTFYQDLAWFGVIVGMALLGVLSRVIWTRVQSAPTSPYRVITAATWIVMLPILLRAGFMPAFTWWLYFLVPTLAIAWLTMTIASRVESRRTVPAGPT